MIVKTIVKKLRKTACIKCLFREMGSDACLSLVLNYKTQILSMADGPSGRFGVNAPVVVVSRLAQGRVPILRLRLVVWIVKGLIPLLSSVLTIVPVSIHGLDYSLEKNGTRDYITLLHQCYLDNIVSPDNSRKSVGCEWGKRKHFYAQPWVWDEQEVKSLLEDSNPTPNSLELKISFLNMKLTHDVFFIVDGQWSAWGAWYPCSKTCGQGTKFRARDCVNPPPSNGGAFCPGQGYESYPCNNGPCPGRLVSCKIMDYFSIDALKTTPKVLTLAIQNKLRYEEEPMKTINKKK